MGLKSLHFALGVVFCLFLFSCAGFGYRYYNVGGNEEGTLIGTMVGDSKAHDLPLGQCKPDNLRKVKCIVMELDEFYRLKADILDARARLVQCEKNSI